jgi:two-component system chemotaxis response regulator CheY
MKEPRALAPDGVGEDDMKTVLITDDSKTSQMLVKTTLSRLPGVDFVFADNGREALAVLEKRKVDLLITDINMPEMDGIALVRAVRETKDAKTLPILIITAKGEEAAREEGLTLGANAYVLKPLSTRDLSDHATRLLGAGATPAAAVPSVVP